MAERIIVTGGSGFIGREVVAQLLARGDEVLVVDDLSKPASESPAGAELVQQDLTDARASRDLFRGARKCIHLAAKIGGIGYFHRHPATILCENDRINASVFEACAHYGYERIVYFSSSMVFENAVRFPSKESDLPGMPAPRSAYGFSKLAGEWYCRAFSEERKLPFSIVRPFNAYGVHEAPGEEVGEAHVIPDLAKKILLGQDPLELLGNGQQTRCFTHVSDIARGAIMVLDSPKAENEDFNLASPEETTMIDLARRLWELLARGNAPFRVEHVESWRDDVQRRVPDVTKAREVLGFEACVRLDHQLPAIVEHLRTRLSPGRPASTARGGIG